MENRFDSRRPPAAPVAVLLRDCSEIVSIVIAGVIGLSYALLLLGFSGVFGTSRFWDLPVGLMGGPLDIRNSLSGYWWFVQDSWRWPLLAVPNPNWPAGANAELFDITPVVAIAGKLLRSGFGWSVNLYPGWVAGCFAMNAAALAALVRALGNRSLLAAIVAAAFGAMAPVVAFRFGHMALMAHWLPVLAVALYFHSRRQPLGWLALGGFCGLCLLAASVHLYLYVMTAAIAAAAVLQALLDRRISWGLGAAACGLFVLVGIGPQWAFGLLAGGLAAGQSFGFGVYSMNLMSPFWPQTSGLFHWTGVYLLTRGSIGGTVGQYEGFDYLGGGILLLLAICLWNGRRDILPQLRRHAGLAAVAAILTIWALSNQIYLGPYRIFHYPVPHFLDATLLSVFRSSGRLFWPVGWLLVGIGVAGGLSSLRREWAIALAVLALLLQWVDVAPWRAKYAALFATPAVSIFGSPENARHVAQDIEKAGAVAVMPPVFCSSAQADFNSPLNAAALEIQVAAAKATARMPSVYLGRQKIDCFKPFNLRPAVIIRLDDVKAPPLGKLVPAGTHCEEFGGATVCNAGRQ